MAKSYGPLVKAEHAWTDSVLRALRVEKPWTGAAAPHTRPSFCSASFGTTNFSIGTLPV
jgi:hypothetical protein